MDAREGDVRRGYGMRESERIEREIDCTRSLLDETVDAITDKLSWRNIVRSGVHMASERAGAGSRQLVQGIKANPVPAALVGLAIAWVVAERTRRSGPVMSPQDPSFGEAGYRHGMGDRVQQAGRAIKEKARDAGEWVKDTGERISSAASTVGEKSADLGHSVRGTAVAAGERVSHLAGQARRGVTDAYDENPLMIGAVAFAVGLIGGLSMPTTRVENKLFGSTSRDLKRKAREVGEKAVEAGQQIASRAAEAAKEAATDENAGDLGGRLANVIGAAAGAVAEEARQQSGSTQTGGPQSNQGQHGDGPQRAGSPFQERTPPM